MNTMVGRGNTFGACDSYHNIVADEETLPGCGWQHQFGGDRLTAQGHSKDAFMARFINNYAHRVLLTRL
jgi:hypothetical protein